MTLIVAPGHRACTGACACRCGRRLRRLPGPGSAGGAAWGAGDRQPRRHL